MKSNSNATGNKNIQLPFYTMGKRRKELSIRAVKGIS
jgi:hypothetical protein